MNDAPDDDIERLFRENDDLGPDSSLWLRPLRQLFKDGKPVGPVIALTVAPTEPAKLPFGILTQTQKDRLVFWPVLPPGANMVCSGEAVQTLDHITLEFPSEKIHATAYDAAGQPVHWTREWRTHHFPDSDIALWFLMLVRVSILQQQATAVQRLVESPPTDKERRVREAVQYTHAIRFVDVGLPNRDGEYDYVYLGVYIVPDSLTPDQLSASILPADPSIDSQVEGWPDGSAYEIAVSRFSAGTHTICVATACPPGRLRQDVAVAFPRRAQVPGEPSSSS